MNMLERKAAHGCIDAPCTLCEQSEAKHTHTPGPWHSQVWNYPRASPPRRDLVIQTDCHRIAQVDWDEGGDNPYVVPHEEAQANARLIASAPELLAACKAIDHWMVHNVPCPAGLLKQAIAKATGKRD